MSLEKAKGHRQRAEDHFDGAFRRMGAGLDEYIKNATLCNPSYDPDNDAIVVLGRRYKKDIEDYKSIILAGMDEKLKDLKPGNK